MQDFFKAITKHCKNIKKETAKAVLEDVCEFVGMNQQFCKIDGEDCTIIDVDTLFAYMALIAGKFEISICENDNL